jgi:phage major head subunit gpT-like protein
MILNRANMATLFTAFKAAFQNGFGGVDPLWQQVATRVPSSTSIEEYGWLGDIPGMREWLGDRQINNLKQHGYTIKNKKFESTVGVIRDNLADDQYGIYTPMMEMMGQNAAEHPNKLVFDLLAAGFAEACYDGQYFFDTDHPVLDESGEAQSVSNVQAGAGSPWFLLDTRRPLKPLIYQERKAPNFVTLDQDNDQDVFMKDKALYGVDSRGNVGYGFWQMAFGSKAALTAENFEAAYDAMGAFKGDYNKALGVQPSLLVVGTSNASKGRKIVQAQLIDGGDSNINYNRVGLLEVPWLS